MRKASTWMQPSGKGHIMKKTITVKGTGKLSAAPDTIEVSIELSSLDRNYEKAMAKEAEALEKLTAAVCGCGFRAEDLKTSQFYVNTEYDGRPDKNGVYRRFFKGYSCRHSLKLKFALDTERLSNILTAISGCLAEPQLSISFLADNKDSLRDLLLESAAKDAKHKAGILAKASGVKLGDLISIDYNWGELNNYSRTEYAMDRKCLANGARTAFVPEDIELSDSAAFVWEID